MVCLLVEVGPQSTGAASASHSTRIVLLADLSSIGVEVGAVTPAEVSEDVRILLLASSEKTHSYLRQPTSWVTSVSCERARNVLSISIRLTVPSYSSCTDRVAQQFGHQSCYMKVQKGIVDTPVSEVGQVKGYLVHDITEHPAMFLILLIESCMIEETL